MEWNRDARIFRMSWLRFTSNWPKYQAVVVGRKHFLKSAQLTSFAAKLRNVEHENRKTIDKQPPPYQFRIRGFLRSSARTGNVGPRNENPEAYAVKNAFGSEVPDLTGGYSVC